jgi:AcrR family transcriptional regulator
LNNVQKRGREHMDKVIKNSTDIKEEIIKATIALIENSEGLVENITIRDISKKAGVAVGLINYHFGSKKKLIEICVQRIISYVMSTFSGIDVGDENQNNIKQSKSKQNMAAFTASVYSFLVDNPEISKISMLGDMTKPSVDSNSSVSYRAIYNALFYEDNQNVRKIKAFLLLSGIQSAFLNREIIHELMGFNMNNEEDYYKFFSIVTEILGMA